MSHLLGWVDEPNGRWPPDFFFCVWLKGRVDEAVRNKEYSLNILDKYIWSIWLDEVISFGLGDVSYFDWL